MSTDCLSGFIKPGKINMIIDGCLGSTGKGVIAAAIARDNFIHIACASLSPNAGHTFYENGQKKITKLLPVAGIWNNDKQQQIYLSAGTVIDVDLLFQEIEEFNIDPNRICIHPRAAVVTQQDREEETRQGGIEKIASTQSGAGAARASKLMRKNPLAQDTPKLKDMIGILPLHEYLRLGLNVLLESGQGVDLGLDHGLAYPYCTSRDVLPAHLLADLGVHPRYLGSVMLIFRTFPIRVGNIVRDGKEVGTSGPFWSDSKETTWEELGVEQEYTTVTKRVRRVATFSLDQYKHSLELVQPTHIFLNFVNYLREEDLPLFKFKKLKKPTHVGFGPRPEQISRWSDSCLEGLLKW